MTIRALRTLAWPMFLLGLVGACVLAGGPANAAKPVRGARYVDTDFRTWASLRVSSSGRRLVPRGSRVEDDCHALRLGTGRRPVRIGRTGRFSYQRKRGRFSLEVSGRFGTRNIARITFRYARTPSRRSRPCDRSGGVSLSPERIRQIAFRSCRTHRAKSIFSNPSGRVFLQREWGGRDGWNRAAHGCLFSLDKQFRLAKDEDDDSDLDLFRIVDPYIAYQQAECPHGCGYSVHVRDLRTGAEVRRGPFPRGPPVGQLTDLELKGNGSIAWIAIAPPGFGLPPSVWTFDRAGMRQRDGGNIALQSLALSGSRLTWTKDGVARSAALD